jgi:spermidine synthase
MVAQESFALIPLMHTTHRDRALVIGYGTGMTARVLQDQGFQHLDVAETSKDIVMMAERHFSNINANISRHPSVSMHYTDGRNYLLTQSKKYDLISLEISSIWFAGAANLYNKEFYELANSRLDRDGVLQQWVQLHHMRPIDYLYILGSVRSVFKYVWVYVSGGQGIIVASNHEGAAHNEAALQKLMASHTLSALQLADLPQRVVAGPAEVDALIARFDPTLKFLVSTDKNLYLEYATPKGNAMREDSMPILIDMMKGTHLK